MRNHRSRFVLGAAVTATAALAAVTATEAKITALPGADAQFRKGATKLAKAIVVNKKLVIRGAFPLLPPGGRPVAYSSTPLAGFPRAGSTYTILSNGDSRHAAAKNNSKSFGHENGGPFVRGARDVLIYRIDLRVPKGKRCLSFRFRFLTEEFPEFVDSDFNDAFIAELDHSTWDARSNEDPTIESPGNFAHDANGNRISVNGTGPTGLSKARAKGTTYDGATRILRASTPIEPGRHRLYLSIFDQGDRQYDSAVFVDKLTLTNSSGCKTGVVIDE
jgi:hypothetical protein